MPRPLPVDDYFCTVYDHYVVPNSLCIIRCLHSESEMQGIMVTAIGTSRYMAAESPWSQSS